MPVAVAATRPRARIGRNRPFKPIPATPPPSQAPTTTTVRQVVHKCCDEPKPETHDGTLICVNCGTQLSEAAQIVSEVTFGETSTGAATVQGGYVGENARHANTLGGQASRRIGTTYQSREETEQNGRSELRQLSTQLRIPQTIEDVAFNLWKLAASNNFIQGRRTNEVAGACLYAACRREAQNTIMLMDISEAQAVNVFKLGDIYKDLCKTLYLEAHTNIKPVMEVEPLLMKYCSRLEFGDKTREVAADAARIIRRMKRDWMVTGRHPAGLCGACIVLAARMNNFRRSVREVVYIVKVSDITINTRLLEFKQTRSSTMSVKGFREKGERIKYQHDPPSLHSHETRRRRMDRMLLKRAAKAEELSNPSNAGSSSPQPNANTATTLTVTRDGSHGSASPDATATDNTAASAADTSMAEQAPASAKRKRNSTRTNDTISRNVDLTEASSPAIPANQESSSQEQSQDQTASPTPNDDTAPRRDADGFAIPTLPASQSRPQTVNVTADVEPTKRRKRATKSTIQLTEDDFASEEELEREMQAILAQDDTENVRHDVEVEKQKQEAELASSTTAADLAQKHREAAAQASIERLTAQGRRMTMIPDTPDIDPSEFDDDPEVMFCKLDEEAARIKETIWLRENEDWLRAQQAKHLKHELELAEGKAEKKKKKRKRSRMGDGSVLEGGTPVLSPADAAARMLEARAGKAYSKNIDYAALSRVFGGPIAEREMGKEKRKRGRPSRSGSVSSATGGASGSTSRSSSVGSFAQREKPKFGEDSFVMETARDIAEGKSLSKKAEKQVLERARRASNASDVSASTQQTAGDDAELSDAVPIPASQVVVEQAPMIAAQQATPPATNPQDGAKPDQPIEVQDNGEEEEEEEDDDEDLVDSDNDSWAPNRAFGHESDGDDIDDRYEADIDGDPDAYTAGGGTFG